MGSRSTRLVLLVGLVLSLLVACGQPDQAMAAPTAPAAAAYPAPAMDAYPVLGLDAYPAPGLDAYPGLATYPDPAATPTFPLSSACWTCAM